jgi:hypothetical protein
MQIYLYVIVTNTTTFLSLATFVDRSCNEIVKFYVVVDSIRHINNIGGFVSGIRRNEHC